MNARRIVALFLLFGVAWILISDHVVDFLFQDAGERTAVQSAKGIVFVALSALLIYLLVARAEGAEASARTAVLNERNRLDHILNVNPAVIYSLSTSAASDTAFVADFVGNNIEGMTGYSMTQWLSSPSFWHDHIHVDDLPAVTQAHARLFETGSVTHEYRFRHANGAWLWINDHVLLIRDAEGRVTGMMGAWLDITDRHNAENRLSLISSVFQSSQEGIFITDSLGHFMSVNQTFTRVTGYSLDELAGKTPAVLRSGRHDRRFYEAMWQQIGQDGRWEGEIWNRRKSGEIYPEWLTISGIRDSQGRVTQYLGIFTETSSRKAAEERIHRLANFDTLTNLPNRALFHDRGRLAIAAATRNQTRMAVMHLNIDRFKYVNDAFGHEAGDQVLVTLARRLGAALNPDDTLSRSGADDFVILLPDTTTRNVAQTALRLLAEAAEPLPVDGQELRLTASIGIAEFPDNGTDLLRLTQAAESALHQAKSDGRNGFQFFSIGMQERITETIAIENDLRFALERHQLVVYFQPQVDVLTNRIIGAEALLRWRHPQRGLVPPGLFIPIAEEAGLINEIGHWVLMQTLTQNAAWQGSGLPKIPIAVNLSVIQFRHAGLAASISQALQASGMPAAMLELELTESIAMEDSSFTVTTIDSLKKLGVLLSIDDFGTGFSSLSYLKRFDVDKLKIDQSFVRGLTKDADDGAIVTAVISLAKSLGLRTIAEGVETQEQLSFLRERGCDEYQGYLFSKPVPAEEFAAQLEAELHG